MEPTTLQEAIIYFADPANCREYLVARRWPNGVECPRCKSKKVYLLASKPWHWVCKNKDCGGRNGYRFSVITKTIFENTNYPLSIWFQVIYLMTQSKKGISALQIHRQIGSGDYRTAWYMVMRVRAAMKDEGLAKLLGTVEVDETFIGGKRGKMHKSKRAAIGWGQKSKIPVIGAISRKGNLVCQMVEEVSANQAERFIRKVVDTDKVELITTDEGGEFRRLKGQGYPHDTVDHKADEYVRGVVHTQNLDNFWSMLKRGIIGTYHKVSKRYLPLYLAEFQYRYNNRDNKNIFFDVIAGC